MLSQESQAQKHNGCMFFPHAGKTDLKDKHIKKQTLLCTNSYGQYVFNSETTLWNLGKEGKEKRMTEHQKYHKT
jgi:hypothetical protein